MGKFSTQAGRIDFRFFYVEPSVSRRNGNYNS